MSRQRIIDSDPRPLMWLWAPMLCMARALMVVTLMLVVMVMLKRNGLSNTWASVGSSLLLLPFVFRHLLRPLVMAVGARRWLILGLQVVFALLMLGVAHHLTVRGGMTVMWVWLAFASLCAGIHDIVAADLCAEWLVGRSRQHLLVCLFFAVLAVMLGLGGSLILAGDLEVFSRHLNESWSEAFKMLAALQVLIALACGITMCNVGGRRLPLREACASNGAAVAQWWSRPGQWAFAMFVIVFSWHEWMVWNGVLLFLGDPGSIGGLSLGPQEVGFAQGTMGTLAIFAGCLIGIGVVSRYGLRRCLWPMALLMTLPDAVLLLLAYVMPSHLWVVSGALIAEDFFCGFGLVGALLYILYYGRGRGMQVHDDACVTLLSVSAMLAGGMTGVLQDYFGYRGFFLIVVATALTALVALAFLRRAAGR